LLAAVYSLDGLGVARYNSDGSLDTSFGDRGMRLVTIGNSIALQWAEAMAVADDGRIIVVGEALGPQDIDAVVACFTADGQVDTTFGGGAPLLLAVGIGNDTAYGVDLDAEGRILVSGTTIGDDGYQRAYVLRLNADGTRDTDFGLVCTGNSGGGVVVQDDGQIDVCFQTAGGAGLMQLNPDGSLAQDFGTAGLATLSGPFSACPALALQSDGRILVIAVAQDPSYSYSLARFTADGQLDSTFGTAGVVSGTEITSDSTRLNLVVGPDDKVVLVGSSREYVTNSFGVACFNADGSPNLDFGGDGQVSTAAAAQYSYAHAACFQPDGKIVAVGGANQSNTGYLALVRYTDRGFLVGEGAEHVTSGYVDAYTGDTLTATIDYGDGSGPQFLHLGADRSFSLDHAYVGVDCSYTFTLTVENAAGRADVQRGVVHLVNAAPVGRLSNSGPVAEHGMASVGFTGVWDSSESDVAAGLRYSFALAESDLATCYADARPTANQAFDFTQAGRHLVYGRVFDQNNASTTYSTTVVVEPVTTVGLFDPSSSSFLLHTANTTGMAEYTFGYGVPGSEWEPLIGDWNGDGTSSIGFYDPAASVFYLRNNNSTGMADATFGYGMPGAGWRPVVGDWNGDGVDTIGLYDPAASVFYLRNTNNTGMADLSFGYGAGGQGWIPLVGDWNGDRIDTVALYQPDAATFHLRNTNAMGFADVTFGFGQPGSAWIPLVGDWNADGRSGVALFDAQASYFYLRNTLGIGMAEASFGYGAPDAGWLPVTGHWTTLATTDAPSALTDAALAPVVTAALARWSAAGLSGSVLERLTNTDVVVADLAGSEVGVYRDGTVYIDRDAAGQGWFVDGSPDSDTEFRLAPNNCELWAVDPAAVDRIDLLTVVEHELGHVAGLTDLDPSFNQLMSGDLAGGIRRLVGSEEVESIPG
jgi:uncharacterized delta-60 repeat protein